MKATVVTGFIDEATKVDYNVGDPYPTTNVDKERLDLLTKPHPKTGKVYVYILKKHQNQHVHVKQRQK